MSVLNFCMRNLMAGPLRVQRTGQTESDTSQSEQRSGMWGQWCTRLRIELVLWGVAFVSADANSEYPMLEDALQPTNLNVERLKCMYRINLHGKAETHVFERAIRPRAQSGPDMLSGAMAMDERYMPPSEVRVIWESYPDAQGVVQSPVRRLYESLFRLYETKERFTMEADRKRARPVVTTKELVKPTSNDPKATSLADPTLRVDEPLSRTEREACDAIFQKDHDCGSATDSATSAAQRSRKRPRAEQQELDPERDAVNTLEAQAPGDFPTVHLMVVEAVCMELGVPMSEISSGDASGRPKLNQATAGPEQARVFRESQAAVKRMLLQEMYRHLGWMSAYNAADAHLASNPNDCSEANMHKARTLAFQKAQKTRSEWVIEFPPNPLKEELQMELRYGLKHECYVQLRAQQWGCPADMWGPLEKEEIMALEGVPPEKEESKESS